MSGFESHRHVAQQELPELMPHADHDLAARVHAGDNQAFAELWSQYGSYAAGAAAKKGASHNDREDLAQETALKL